MSEYKKYFMDDDISVYTQTGYDQIEHLHDFIELVYVSNGKGVHKVDKTVYPVKKGNLVIINYNQTHSFSCESSYKHYSILIKPEFINEKIKKSEDIFSILDISGYEDFKNLINKENCVIGFSLEEMERFESTLKLLKTELKDKNPGYNITSRAYINLIFTMIFRKMSQPLFFSNDVVNSKILDYINTNYNEKITANYFAKEGHYDISYFSRMFKKYTGLTFTHYLKKVRINKACEFIKNTDYKISEIYTKVGYSDKTKFYKHFSEIMNTTPLKYRKSQK